MRKDQILELEKIIFKTLYTDQYKLMEYFEGVHFVDDRLGWHDWNKKDYSTKQPFSKIYPTIFNYFKNDCNDWYVKNRKSGKGHSIETPDGDFDFDSIDELFDNAMAKLKISNVKLLKLKRTGTFDYQCYILTTDQKKAIEKLFNRPALGSFPF